MSAYNKLMCCEEITVGLRAVKMASVDPKTCDLVYTVKCTRVG